jgi:hypothetical protein
MIISHFFSFDIFFQSDSFWIEACGAMKGTQKKFLGIMFECCNIYQRIYLNKEGNAYEGHCPKCFAEVKALIGADGSASRFFRAR